MKPDASPQEALHGFDVSRETFEKLVILVEELGRWQAIKNLVGPGTLGDVWRRHVADSLQLLDLAPGVSRWLDLGSGAGFPGLVLAIAGVDRTIRVDLVESNSRKCAFLRHVARLTGAPATIHNGRIETLLPDFVGKVEVVCARALAPLPQLLLWTEPLLTKGAVGLFPKGRDALSELTDAQKLWRFEAEAIPSRTDSEARILRVAHLAGPTT